MSDGRDTEGPEDGDGDGAPGPGEPPGAGDPRQNPNVRAMAFWDEVVADMEATAGEYAERGWETLQLHPGDVTPQSGEYADRVGLDVLVPDNEYEELAALLDGGVDFDSYRVYKADSGGMVFLLVAMEDSAAEAAVLFPAYYQPSDPQSQGMLDRAHEEGELRSYLRRLSGEFVELSHDEPSLFEPEERPGTETSDDGE